MIDGLPIGMMLIGRHGEEATILRLADAIPARDLRANRGGCARLNGGQRTDSTAWGAPSLRRCLPKRNAGDRIAVVAGVPHSPIVNASGRSDSDKTFNKMDVAHRVRG